VRLKQGFLHYLGSRSGVAQPRCGDEQAARAGGLPVVSDSGDTIKWCVGEENGQLLVRVANNRRTYTQVSYPDAWTVSGSSTFELSPNSVARALGTGDAKVTQLSGRTARLVDGGDTLTLLVPPGGTGRVTAEPSITGWFVDAIFFGVEFASEVLKVAGFGEAGAGRLARMAAWLAGAVNSDYKDAFRKCTLSVSELTGNHAATIAVPLLKYLWKCVPPWMVAHAKSTGLVITGAVLSAVVLVIGTVLDALHVLLTGARDVFDEVASLLSGRSDTIYDIVLLTNAGTAQRARGLARSSQLPPDLVAQRGDGCGRLLRWLLSMPTVTSSVVPASTCAT